MGLITKYELAFPDLGLALSNHLALIPRLGLNDLVLDADVEVTMTTGAAGASFEIKLHDLPQEQLKKLDARRRTDRALAVEIQLGFLDGKVEPVLSGLVKQVSAKVDGGKLVTTLKGQETATFAAHDRRVDRTLAEPSTIRQAIEAALETPAEDGPVIADTGLAVINGVRPEHLPDEAVPNRTLRGRLVRVLDGLAREVGATVLLVDGKVWVGRPVEHDGTPQSPELVADENLVRLEPFTKTIAREFSTYRLNPLEADSVHGFKFLVLGDPKLRPGQVLEPDVEDYSELSSGTFRVSAVKHRFTLAGGYVCDGVALKTCPPGDEACRRQLEAGQAPSADAVAAHVSSEVESFPRRRPFIEMGAIKQYRAGGAGGEASHRADLYYNQRIPPEETQPSVRVAVDRNEEKVFTSKPFVSPFAWKKCGLVTPVYPGMKAVLQHNQGLADDALVGGFLWSQEPELEPPRNEPGDWWLCLPVDPPADEAPPDDTKAVNDLTAKSGLRTIEAKGLKITVGEDTLRTIGQRPEPGSADELLITHKSGAEIKIDSDGKVTINAPGGLEITGDVTVSGTVDIS